jgi:glycosyltransferase involved in cell wall biosynthesis
MLLSVVMPAYNEVATLRQTVDRVLKVPIDKELVIVDDGSTDGTREILKELEADSDVRVFYQDVNRGKGAALRRGLAENEYPKLIQPILDDKADVVFGSRFAGGHSRRVLYFWHSIGNRLLTTLSNMLTNLNLTDMETCYKVFRREVVETLSIEEDRFGVEPEITAKLARGRWRIYEVGITYAGRTYEEGKKIGWRDGLQAIYCILKYNLRR